jgi:hypothetical protein
LYRARYEGPQCAHRWIPPDGPRGSDQFCLTHRLVIRRASRRYVEQFTVNSSGLRHQGDAPRFAVRNFPPERSKRAVRDQPCSRTQSLVCRVGCHARWVQRPRRRGRETNGPGVQSLGACGVHTLSSDPNGIPHSRQRALATEGRIRLPEGRPLYRLRICEGIRFTRPMGRGVNRPARDVPATQAYSRLVELSCGEPEREKPSRSRPNAVTLGGEEAIG